MAFDFKKAEKAFFRPKASPGIVTVPGMRFLAVRGKGNPNEEGGAYQTSVGLLYGIAYTLKMSKKSDRKIDGYFDFVVPPLEGFWWQKGMSGYDPTRKDLLQWISAICLPDFVGRDDFAWAVRTAEEKKKQDYSAVEYFTHDEGLTVQILHTGSFDAEPASVALMDAFIAEQGYENDFSLGRYHHEIYLSDPRNVPQDKSRTVIRHPIRKKILA